MDFVIKNNKNVYIRLSENGKAETCKEKNMGKFTEQKAKNILKSLPKTLKNLNFRIECIPDIKMETPVQKIVKEESKKIIENTDYQPSGNITQWVEKFGACSDIFKEARERYVELEDELHTSDAALMDALHSIELEAPKDLYSAWLVYKKIRENRRNRRQEDMFCSEYEMTECGTKLCCHDCDNEKCEKRCTIEKAGCDCLCESEPVPFDERYTETQIN